MTEAEKKYYKDYRSKNKNKLKVYGQEYYKKHKKEKDAYSKQYAIKNRDQINKYHGEWSKKNRDRIRVQYKHHGDKEKREQYLIQYRLDNKNKRSIYQKKYYKSHKIQIKKHWEKRKLLYKMSGEYRGKCNTYQKTRRHLLGINKKYVHEMGISYTREYRRMHGVNRRNLELSSGEISITTIQRVYEDNIKKYGTLTCYLCEKPIEFKQDSLEHKTPLTRGGTNVYENLGIAHRKCNSKKNIKTEKEYRVWIKNGEVASAPIPEEQKPAWARNVGVDNGGGK